MGYSILNGLIEDNHSKQHNVRIRKFHRATVDDLSYHIHPILRKNPKQIIAHIRTNDAIRSTSREIFDKLLNLRTLIQEILLETEVTFSTPTLRWNNGKSALTVRNLCDHVLGSNVDILEKRNITSKHLVRKSFHLNKAGSTRLAKNIIHKLHKFWWSLEYLNESPARVSGNISQPPISCNSLNSNYTVYSKIFAKDETISSKNLSITNN